MLGSEICSAEEVGSRPGAEANHGVESSVRVPSSCKVCLRGKSSPSVARCVRKFQCGFEPNAGAGVAAVPTQLLLKSEAVGQYDGGLRYSTHMAVAWQVVGLSCDGVEVVGRRRTVV